MKHFKATATALVACFFFAACSGEKSHTPLEGARPLSGCPTLPENAGLAWQQSRLEHGITCYALRPDGTIAFGLWAGTTRVDMPRDATFIAAGQVAGIPVRWVRKKSDTSRQAHASLSNGLQLHAFVPDLPRATLQERLGVLSALALRSAP